MLQLDNFYKARFVLSKVIEKLSWFTHQESTQRVMFI